MKIQSITIFNFRCFGPEPERIGFDDGITTFVGSNGSGKTAALLALVRLFGITRSHRTVVPEDFHIPTEVEEGTRPNMKLWVEVRLAFPELEEEEVDHAASIPSTFHHMMVDTPGEAPYCRLRLEAEWADDHTIDGTIEQKIFWLLTADQEPKEEHKVPLSSHDRGLIQAHYLPATRGASGELQTAIRQILGRLFAAADWSQSVKEAIEEAGSQVQEDFSGEDAVQVLNGALKKHWDVLYDGGTDAIPSLQPISQKFEEVIRKTGVIFHPNEQGGTREPEDLSEGQKALFYFAVATAVFDVESRVRERYLAGDPIPGFITDKLDSPVLTLFAVEEPENHLAPFYLSRIVRQLSDLAGKEGCQAIFTSHSPAILGRVEPRAVRHFRLDPEGRVSRVRPLRLPEDNEQASKYLREAVLAYPELYFARFVVLAEGDSEQVVIPRLASAMGLDIDPSFVAVVPLGGRHVNHFWNLLSDLEIPYVTLLDFDLGRNGGGWGRIKYACQQLLDRGYDRTKLLQIDVGKGKTAVLTRKEFNEMHTWDEKNTKSIRAWKKFLEAYGVFFSYPLDLDMAMLKRFPKTYKEVAEGTPRSTPASAAVVVLGDTGTGCALYEAAFPKSFKFFPWYRYLFLSRSKPATHLRALSMIENTELKAKSPSFLKRLLRHVDREVKRNARCCAGE